jgi:heptose I phosphotransferase
MDFEDWDAGRLRVNQDFGRILEANRLTSFEALFDFAGGTVVREVGSRRTARIVLQGADGRGDQTFFLKRHSPPRLSERLRPLFSLSMPIVGARNEWEGILKFHAAGIPTMTPVAFGEHNGRSLVMTQDLGTPRTLLDWVNETAGEHSGPRQDDTAQSSAVKHELIARVADIARRMHSAGLHHQDFYLNHMLCCGEPETPDIRVIDLGRVRKQRRLSRRWILKDLAQLDFSARKLSCADRLRFLRLYLGRPFRSDDRWLVRGIALKSRQIGAHTMKNDL